MSRTNSRCQSAAYHQCPEELFWAILCLYRIRFQRCVVLMHRVQFLISLLLHFAMICMIIVRIIIRAVARQQGRCVRNGLKPWNLSQMSQANSLSTPGKRLQTPRPPNEHATCARTTYNDASRQPTTRMTRVPTCQELKLRITRQAFGSHSTSTAAHVIRRMLR